MLHNVIDVMNARLDIEEQGYQVRDIQPINEGANHYVFSVDLSNGKKAICKYAKIRLTESGLQEPNCDTLFGSPLSLERESYLFDLARTQGRIKTPKVYGIHHGQWGNFIMLERMPGISYKDYLRKTGFSKQRFLGSLSLIARDFANLHQLTFNGYGALVGADRIVPPDLDNFADYYITVLSRRIYRCIVKGVFTEKEIEPIQASLYAQLNNLRTLFTQQRFAPTFVITDMHAENFFISLHGKSTSYFDIESSLAAPALLEFFGFRFFLFNYYDENTFFEAEDTFFTEYQKEGGRFPVSTTTENRAVDFFAACRLLELSESYWGYVDGIRDTWGKRMKNLLLKYIEDAKVDYQDIGDIWRMRDHQPKTPLMP